MRLIIATQISPFDYVSAFSHVNIKMAYSAFEYTFGIKTLSQEISDQNITFNIIAPGSHTTPAIVRLIKKDS